MSANMNTRRNIRNCADAAHPICSALGNIVNMLDHEPLAPCGRGAGERGKGNSRDFARSLRKTMTDIERAIWKELRAHRFSDLKFKRQQPLGDYVVDFVCLGKRVVIELDGGQHAENISYDTARDNWLESQGFRVLRFWNNDVLNNREGVLMVIAEACGLEAGFSPLSPDPSPAGGEG